MRSANHSELSNALLAISQSLADRSQLAQTLDAVLTAATVSYTHLTLPTIYSV